MKKKTGKTHRAPNGEVLLWLVKLIRRIRSSTPLSRADRNGAALILEKIAQDQDARELFYQAVSNRPKADDGGLRYASVFIYLASIELTNAKPGKKLQSEVAALARLKPGQFDHALRDYRELVQSDIDGMDAKHMEYLSKSYGDRLRLNSLRAIRRGN